MKKTLSLVLALVLVLTLAFSMVACGGKDEDVKDPETTDTPADTDENPADTDETPADTDETPAGETWGKTLLGVFNDAIAANPAATADELAQAVISHESILFFGGVTPMEAGAEWMPGFTEAPTGWATCANFGPMMGSIAFVGPNITPSLKPVISVLPKPERRPGSTGIAPPINSITGLVIS